MLGLLGLNHLLLLLLNVNWLATCSILIYLICNFNVGVLAVSLHLVLSLLEGIAHNLLVVLVRMLVLELHVSLLLLLLLHLLLLLKEQLLLHGCLIEHMLIEL